jgi:MoxR-like ATPase
MEEGSVTIDGVSRQVGVPFLVLATQNPVEQAGTYRLPEAQLDRFMMRLRWATPTMPRRCASSTAPRGDGRPLARDHPAGDGRHGRPRRAVYVDALVLDYIARLVDGTRSADEVRLGVSIRGALALTKASRTRAASQGSHVRRPRTT